MPRSSWRSSSMRARLPLLRVISAARNSLTRMGSPSHGAPTPGSDTCYIGPQNYLYWAGWRLGWLGALVLPCWLGALVLPCWLGALGLLAVDWAALVAATLLAAIDWL